MAWPTKQSLHGSQVRQKIPKWLVFNCFYLSKSSGIAYWPCFRPTSIGVSWQAHPFPFDLWFLAVSLSVLVATCSVSEPQCKDLRPLLLCAWRRAWLRHHPPLSVSYSLSFSPTKSFKTQAFLFYYFYSSLSFTSMIFGKRKEKVGLLIPLD